MDMQAAVDEAGRLAQQLLTRPAIAAVKAGDVYEIGTFHDLGEPRPYLRDNQGRRWLLDGSGDVA